MSGSAGLGVGDVSSFRPGGGAQLLLRLLLQSGGFGNGLLFSRPPLSQLPQSNFHSKIFNGYLIDI